MELYSEKQTAIISQNRQEQSLTFINKSTTYDCIEKGWLAYALNPAHNYYCVKA